jgi:hypothetical protein
MEQWWRTLETGAVVEVAHVGSALRFRALVEKRSDGDAGGDRGCALPVVSLGRIERPYEKLRVALNGATGWAVAAAKFAALQLEEVVPSADGGIGAVALGDAVAYVRLKPVAHQKKANRSGGLGWYIGAATASDGDSHAQPQLVGDAGADASSLFTLAVVSTRGAFALDSERTRFSGSFDREPSSLLTDSQRHAFMRDGFLQIRDVVPMKLVNAALRRINHELGIPGRMVDGGVEGAGKLAGSVANSPELLSLFSQCDAGAYAEALVGRGKLVPPRGGQIALRFPELGEPRDPTGTEWHTDGMRQGRRHPFTLLLGITLSNVSEPLAGNFTVFPGSHRSLHKLLRDDGKLDGFDDECYRADSVWGDGTLPDLGVPVQLLASRGDIVLAHPNLAHRGGLNFSPDVRYQIYFRLKHVDHEALHVRAAQDLYVDLEGLHHLSSRTGDSPE